MQAQGLNLVECDPMLAQNLIYGGVRYAESLGLPTDPEFRITQYILDKFEDLAPMDIEFGKDGKPLFIPSPYDNVEAILNTLTRTVGKDNFHYIMQINPFSDDFEDDETDEKTIDFEEVK